MHELGQAQWDKCMILLLGVKLRETESSVVAARGRGVVRSSCLMVTVSVHKDGKVPQMDADGDCVAM